MNSKSTLESNRENMTKCETFYEGSWGSELLFKARSQSVEVNGRTHRWSADRCRLCKVCGSRGVESVFHIIAECEKYEQERQVFMDEVNTGMEDLFERWLRMNEELCTLLGI